MDDLISRQGAINKCRKRLYESAANNVGYKCNADKVFVDIAENRIETWLNELPSAQPEIIRCKDCEDYQTDWETSYPDRHYCATMDSTMPEDGFCSYAERRDDEA